MRALLRPLLAGLLGLSAALLVACGDGNGLISDRDGARLESDLSAIESACNDARPSAAFGAASRLAQNAADLPDSVDSRLRTEINKGVNALGKNLPDQCAATETTPTETETTPTVTETTPTLTETIPTTPTATQTAPTTPELPPETTPVVPPAAGGTPGPEGDEE